MSHSELTTEARKVLRQLMEVLQNLSLDEYSSRLPLLDQSSIGAHCRHIIELFQQLLYGYDADSVNYESRERNKDIETNIEFAMDSIAHLISKLDKSDKAIALRSIYLSDEKRIQTTYFRELIYNIEHCIHHQAIIKIGLLSIGKNLSDHSFGVAKSTIDFRR